MMRLTMVIWVMMVLMVLNNPVHALRRSSRNRGIRTRSKTRSQMWVPQVLEDQVPYKVKLSDPWVPSNITSHTQTIQHENPWVPHQIPSSIPDDTWGILEIDQTGECSFIYGDVPKDHIHPFLVDPEKQEFVYPDIVRGQQRITMTSGTTVLAACPGRSNSLANINRPYVYITCRNSQLYRGFTPMTWKELGCSKTVKSTLKAGSKCGKDSRTHYIGWSIRRRLFLPQITVCFNTKEETSVSTSHTIHGRYIDAKVVETSRPSFKSRQMFSVSLNRSYRKVAQTALGTKLLGRSHPITGRGENYLAKGHLAPDADFVLEAEQDATYYYINAVPQWQAVNNGNWKSLEFAVRKLAEKRQATFQVYSGTHGILELPDGHNHPVKMFLGQSYGKEVVPVPALLWKVIHNAAANTAVAFVVVNDVSEKGSSESSSLSGRPCPDVCSRLAWVDWDVTETAKGLTFCCTVGALRATIPDIPTLGHVGLLV